MSRGRGHRSGAARLAEEGHEVTYLTLRQWDAGDEPDVPGVRIVAVGPRMPLYVCGRRRILPPLVFGLGVLRQVRLPHRHEVRRDRHVPAAGVRLGALDDARPLGAQRLLRNLNQDLLPFL